jgi:hypothetical protein
LVVERRAASSQAADDPGALVAALSNEDAGLPAGWNGRPWSTTRGATDPLTPEARAVRVGARLVDLELAVRARDTSAAQFAAEVATLLEEIPASGPVVSAYRQVAHDVSKPQSLRPLLDNGRSSAARLVGNDFALLGAWAEAGRVAAARRDASYLHSDAARAALERATRVVARDSQADAVVARIRSAAASGDAPDWGSLEQDFSTLLRVTGS